MKNRGAYVVLALQLLLVVTFVTTAACAAKARHATVVVDSALYEAINVIHGTEQTALCGAPSCAGRAETPVTGWSHDKSLAFNKKLLVASEAGTQLNVRLAAWQAGQPVPVEVQQLVSGLGDSLAVVISDFPAGAGREKILQEIALAQKISLTILSSVLTIAGK